MLHHYSHQLWQRGHCSLLPASHSYCAAPLLALPALATAACRLQRQQAIIIIIIISACFTV
jgi:hypothetical protein